MATKKNPAAKKAPEKTNAPAQKKYPPPPQKKTPPPPPPPPKSEEITAVGLYQIKSEVGALSIKAIPLPGKRVLIVLPGSSKLVENLSIVRTGIVYSLK